MRLMNRNVIGFPTKPKRRPWRVYYHILPNVDYFFYVQNTIIVTWYDEHKHKISKLQVTNRNGIVTAPFDAKYVTIKGKCISASIAWKGTQEYEEYKPYEEKQKVLSADTEMWHVVGGWVTEIVKLEELGVKLEEVNEDEPD